MERNMEHTIYVEREKLTDGSEVFNVRLGDTLLHATDENEACTLAEMIAEGINKKTVDAAEVHYG
jgi:hypothetical protein